MWTQLPTCKVIDAEHYILFIFCFRRLIRQLGSSLWEGALAGLIASYLVSWQ